MNKIIKRQNKIALITGVSKGIGKAIMIKFINRGYFVYGTYNSSILEASEIRAKYKGKVQLLQVDFTKINELHKFITKIKSIKLDVVVNNAGMIEFENFNDFDKAIWYKTMQVNLNTQLELSISLAQNIKEGGSIINISSTDAYTGSFVSMSYSASKAGVISITKSLANNLGSKNVRVNAVAPGWINTGMSTNSSFEACKLTPLGRNGKPDEVAEVVYFLSSKKASFINGTVVNVDGGYSNVDYIMKMESNEYLQ